MSSLKAPSQRARDKTSELADYIRSTAPPPSQRSTQQPPPESRIPAAEDVSGPKKRSKIPSFFTAGKRTATPSEPANVKPLPSLVTPFHNVPSTRSKASRVMQLTRKSLSESIGSRNSVESRRGQVVNATSPASSSSSSSAAALTSPPRVSLLPPVVPPLNLAPNSPSLSSKFVSHFKTPVKAISDDFIQAAPTREIPNLTQPLSITTKAVQPRVIIGSPRSIYGTRTVPTPKPIPKVTTKRRPSHLAPLDSMATTPGGLSPPTSSTKHSFESPRSSTSTQRPSGSLGKTPTSAVSFRNQDAGEYINPRTAPTPPASARIDEERGSYFDEDDIGDNMTLTTASSTSTARAQGLGPSSQSVAAQASRFMSRPFSLKSKTSALEADKAAATTRNIPATVPNVQRVGQIGFRGSQRQPIGSPRETEHAVSSGTSIPPSSFPGQFQIPRTSSKESLASYTGRVAGKESNGSPEELSRSPSRERLVSLGRSGSREMLSNGITLQDSKDMSVSGVTSLSGHDSLGSSLASAGPVPNIPLPPPPSSSSPISVRPANFVRRHTHSAVRQLEDVLGTRIDIGSDDDSDSELRAPSEDTEHTNSPATNSTGISCVTGSDSHLPTPPPSLALLKFPKASLAPAVKRQRSATSLQGSTAPTHPPSMPLPGVPLGAPTFPRNSTSSHGSSGPIIPSPYFSTDSSASSRRSSISPNPKMVLSPLRTQGSSPLLSADNASTDGLAITSSAPASPISPIKVDAVPSKVDAIPNKVDAVLPERRGSSPFDAVYPKPSVQIPLNTGSTTGSDDCAKLKRELLDSQDSYKILFDYSNTIQEKLEREKAMLEKRVEILEREVRKRDKEITGLRYLVLQPHTKQLKMENDFSNFVEAAMHRTPSLSRSASSPHLAIAPMPLTATDVISAADRSAFASGQRNKPGTRSRAATLPRADAPTSAAPWQSHFHSVISAESSVPALNVATSSIGSPSSSRSSMVSLPGLTAATSPASILSVIPESPSMGPVDSNDTDISSDEDQGKVELDVQASRMGPRQRSVTLPPPSIITQAFAAGRAPSIDQVLTRESSMENVLEKLKLHGAF